MNALSQYVVPVTVGIVFLVLVAGLFTMLRGNNASLSQTLMRWRVGLQFLAIIVIMLAIYFKRSV
jgi:Hypoxia induced protein conserved region